MGEGHHLYKIKGTYYDLSAIPGGAVNQMVAKAPTIDGPWTATTMVDAESLGISANPRAPISPTGVSGSTRAASSTLHRANGGAPSCPIMATAAA